MFIDHHRHTHFSVLDAVTRVEDLVAEAKTREQTAVTVTDHGTLGGIYNLWKSCKAAGIKPIIGCEIYWVDDYDTEQSNIPYNYGHMIILAMNAVGWSNLKILMRNAWENGFLKKPRVSIKDLIEHNEGLLITTGCENGLVGFDYLKKNMLSAKHKIKKRLIKRRLKNLMTVFKDRIYAEIQLNDMPEQVRLNKYVLRLARLYGLPFIVTMDGHYISKEQSNIHDAVICVKWRESVNDAENHTYATKQLWLKDVNELRSARDLWHDYISDEMLNQAIDETVCLANRIEAFNLLPEGSPLPIVSETPDTDLDEICKKHPSWGKLMKEKEYRLRYKEEYRVITSLKFSNYFLVVYDIANFCRKNDIPYNARGSVNGSLIAFLMNITWVDPIRFDCPFERFLTKERLTLPDIDMDFSKELRSRVLDYVIEKYGNECVAHICNYTKWKPKSAIKDAAKVFDMDFGLVNSITSKIDDGDTALPPNSSYEDYKKNWDEIVTGYPQVAEFLEENEDIENTAVNLLGVNRQTGVHASGVVVTRTPVHEWCPIAYSLTGGKNKKKDVKVTEWDMYALEDLGILKLDFLGQNTLDIIARTVALIKERHKVSFSDFDGLCEFMLEHLEDQDVYEMIGKGLNVGLFQLGTSDGMIKLSQDMKPDSIEDIIAIISLYRTGVLEKNMHTEYVNRKHGQYYQYLHPKMESVLGKSYGVLLFQEQASKLAVVLAGFTPSESDNFRKGIKLKDPRKFAVWKEKFYKGCKEKSDIDQALAEEIWGFIEAFSKYTFNRCVEENQLVLTIEGEKKIRDINVGDLVATHDEDGIHFDPVQKVYDNGEMECYEICFDDGEKLSCTLDHRLLCDDGEYRTLRQLIESDFSYGIVRTI